MFGYLQREFVTMNEVENQKDVSIHISPRLKDDLKVLKADSSFEFIDLILGLCKSCSSDSDCTHHNFC